MVQCLVQPVDNFDGSDEGKKLRTPVGFCCGDCPGFGHVLKQVEGPFVAPYLYALLAPGAGDSR